MPTTPRVQKTVDLPGWAAGLLERPERYLVIHSGRHCGKSFAIATVLALRMAQVPGTVVVVIRQFRVSAADGAIALLHARCQDMGIPSQKAPMAARVTLPNGSYAYALGADRNINNLRGLETAQYAWLEEAHSISQEALTTIGPSVRRPGSKIIVSFNPYYELDPVWQTFCAGETPPQTWVHKVRFEDHLQFHTPEVIAEREAMRGHPQWAHVWDGELISLVGSVFDVSRVQPAVDTPDAPRSIRAWDLAATQDGGDFTVGLLLRRLDDGFHIADVIRGQWGSGRVEKEVMAAAQRDGKGVRIAIERGPGDAGERDARRWTMALAGWRFDSVRPSGQKAERARPVATAINNGVVTRQAGATWFPAFASELAAFSEYVPDMRTRHDDQVDALATAYNLLTEKRERREKVSIF